MILLLALLSLVGFVSYSKVTGILQGLQKQTNNTGQLQEDGIRWLDMKLLSVLGAHVALCDALIALMNSFIHFQ